MPASTSIRSSRPDRATSARGGRGVANADQISRTPSPTPRPTSAPMSFGFAEETSYVDADPLVVVRARRHPDAAAERAPAELEDRLGLDDVLLDPPGHPDDLGHPTMAAVVDLDVDDEVHRRG